MSIGGFDSISEAEAADIADALAAEIGSFPDAPNIDVSPSPGFVEEIEAALGRGVSPELGPSPQDIQDIQLQQQVFDDLTLPQEAIQTGLGILAEDADPFVPSGLLPLDESGQRQLAIPLQIQDVARQFLTPANVLGLLSPGLGAATRIGGPLLRDIFTTPKLTPTQEVLNTKLTTDALTGQPVGLPDLDELRRQQIGLPVEEEDTTTDESPFFQPVTDVAFLDPREPNLLNQTPANLQAFLTARNLPNVDFQALNTAFAQRPPFGLPIASNTRTPSLLS
tara:strand:+ start:5612 stop:6451 length:840 start_codon:yes stop_codon:yes gene_type:complete